MQIPGLRLDGPLDGLPWRSTRYDGIAWLDLAPSGDSTESKTVLIRMDPGCGYPEHRHLGAEDVLVLAGGYKDVDGRTFPEGTFVRYAAGSVHHPVALGDSALPTSQTNPACVLFAVAHGGTEPVDQEPGVIPGV